MEPKLIFLTDLKVTRDGEILCTVKELHTHLSLISTTLRHVIHISGPKDWHIQNLDEVLMVILENFTMTRKRR